MSTIGRLCFKASNTSSTVCRIFLQTDSTLILSLRLQAHDLSRGFIHLKSVRVRKLEGNDRKTDKEKDNVIWKGEIYTSVKRRSREGRGSVAVTVERESIEVEMRSDWEEYNRSETRKRERKRVAREIKRESKLKREDRKGG